jgi:drug/metabolite transporter, DME family
MIYESIGAIVVAFLWAFYPFIIKYNVPQKTPPIMIWSILSIVTGIVAIPTLYLFSKKEHTLTLRNIGIVTIAAIIGPVVAMLLFLQLMMRTSNASHVMVLAFSTPLFAALIGTSVYGESLSIMTWVGILMMTVGLILVVLSRDATR